MSFYVYSVYDKVAGLYGQPFVAVRDGVAIRSFMEFVNNSYSGKDCQLFKIGEFDNVEGLINAYSKPEFISNPLEDVK